MFVTEVLYFRRIKRETVLGGGEGGGEEKKEGKTFSSYSLFDDWCAKGKKKSAFKRSENAFQFFFSSIGENAATRAIANCCATRSIVEVSNVPSPNVAGVILPFILPLRSPSRARSARGKSKE